jgi:hypothetical protein
MKGHQVSVVNNYKPHRTAAHGNRHDRGVMGPRGERVGARRGRQTLRSITAAGALALLALAPAAGAPASAIVPAPPIATPTVSTGPASAVSYGSATLIGSIDPRGSNTTYYFQYGSTKAFGAQTALADAGAGKVPATISVAVSGLQPVTTYYYRLIAVNAGGATTGAIRAFVTAKVPLSLQILAAPNPVLYGNPIVIQGTLSGTGNGGREVVLQSNTFPYTAGFVNQGNPEVTTAAGGFSFPVIGLIQATQFRVVTTTKLAVVSPITTETVAVRVTAHIGRTRRRHHARIYGTVTPAITGTEVTIVRITHGREVPVAGTFLHRNNATSSRFSRVLPVRRGLYRVLVTVTNGAQASNDSAPLLIR